VEAFLRVKIQTIGLFVKIGGLMKLAQTDLDSRIAVEGQAPPVAALANMERELGSAESYAQIRKLADAAEALKILFRHVAEGKTKPSLSCSPRTPASGKKSS
jgi:hypothetical protein